MSPRLARLILPLALAASPVWADTPQPPVVAGPCANCHGPAGRSPGAIPSIAGMDADVMRDRLRAFRDGTAPSTVMGRLMRGYDDPQIEALADWFAEMPK